jgi:hypothetical protein
MAQRPRFEPYADAKQESVNPSRGASEATVASPSAAHLVSGVQLKRHEIVARLREESAGDAHLDASVLAARHVRRFRGMNAPGLRRPVDA